MYGCLPPSLDRATRDDMVQRVGTWGSVVVPAPTLCQHGIQPVLDALAQRAISGGRGGAAQCTTQAAACVGDGVIPCFSALHVRLEADMCRTAPTELRKGKPQGPAGGRAAWNQMRARLCRTTPAVSEACVHRLGESASPRHAHSRVAASVLSLPPHRHVW